jgi:hypothetical protein
VSILSAFSGSADTGNRNGHRIASLIDARTKVFFGEAADHPDYFPEKIDENEWKKNAAELTFKEKFKKLKAKAVWYRIESLPINLEDLEQPTLYISAYLSGLYVYLNGRRIYRYGTLSIDGSKIPLEPRLNHALTIALLSIPTGFPLMIPWLFILLFP